jgi:hypothetical protein
MARLVNDISDKIGIDPLRIPAVVLERERNGRNVLSQVRVRVTISIMVSFMVRIKVNINTNPNPNCNPNQRSVTEVEVRYSAVCVLNKAALVALPLTDFGRIDQRVPLVSTDMGRFVPFSLNPPTLSVPTIPNPTFSPSSILPIPSTLASTLSSSISPTPPSLGTKFSGTKPVAPFSLIDSLGMAPSGRVFFDVKKAVFTRTKMNGLWSPAVSATTTATG